MSTLGPYRRTSRREPCPICDKPDGCIIFNDGRGVACLRFESDRETPGGWWYHRIGDQTGDWRDHLPNFEATPAPERPVVDDELCDRAYRALLVRCPLSAAHRAHLRERGMSDAEIERAGYGSLPATGRAELAAAVIADVGVDVLGKVPGFHRHEGAATLRSLPGLIIPVMSAAGAILRFRVRPDDPAQREKGKYRWVSSSDFEGGIGSGTVVHVAFPKTRQTAYARVGLTEGEIKAAISATKTGMPFYSMPGVGAIGALAKAIPSLRAMGVREVVMAFDADATTNPQVASGLNRAVDLLESEGFTVSQATWPAEFKGIDDALVASVMPMIERETRKADPSADDMTTAELRRTYKELTQLHSAVMQTLRNSALNPTERIVAISLMKNINWASSRETDGEAFHIPAIRIAEDAGVSQSTAAAAIKTIETGLVIPARGVDSDADPEPIHLFDRTVKFSRNVAHKGTGEIRDVKQAYYTPRTENLRESLSLLARAEKIKPRAHGGKRSIVCPDHPDANIVVRWNRHCGECDRLLESGETVQSPRAAIVDEPVTGLNEQDAVLVADAPVGTVNRTVKSPAFHKADQGPDYATWVKQNPILAEWAPPPPSVAPKRVIVHGEEVF